MSLSGTLNTAYPKATLVSDKYHPLDKISGDPDDFKKSITSLIGKREGLFNTSGIDLNNIKYCGVDLNSVPAQLQADGQLPPLVVISSNRSKWIKAGYDQGQIVINEINKYEKEQENEKEITHFINVIDKRALLGDPSRGVLAPDIPPSFYIPFRQLDFNTRPTFIFVHVSEYRKYMKNLKGTNMKIIGWQICGNCVGFGASRYAAIEFFKNINKLNDSIKNNACSKVWLLDDNVSYIRSFPTFQTTENLMNDKLIGLGFMGGTKALEKVELDKALNSNANEANNPICSPLLQQAVLWNIAQFNKLKCNFSPLFFASAEDSTFTKFIKPEMRKYYKSCAVLKSSLQKEDYDNSQGNKKLSEEKKIFERSLQQVSEKYAFDWNSGNTLIGLLKQFSDTKNSPEKTFVIAIEQILAKAQEKGNKLRTTVRNTNSIFEFNGEMNIELKDVSASQ